MSDQIPMTPPEDAAANRRSSRSDGSATFSARFRTLDGLTATRQFYEGDDVTPHCECVIMPWKSPQRGLMARCYWREILDGHEIYVERE